MHDAWNLLETIHHNKETYNEWEQNKEGALVDYTCIEKFLNTGEEDYLIESFSLDHDMIVRIVRAYAEYLQVPQNWDQFEPPDARRFMMAVVGGKLAQEKEERQLLQEPSIIMKKECPPQKKKEKRLERNLSIVQ